MSWSLRSASAEGNPRRLVDGEDSFEGSHRVAVEMGLEGSCPGGFWDGAKDKRWAHIERGRERFREKS